jgi:hypothetical protein
MPETQGPPLIAVLVHLVVWAQLGVFSRAAIAKFFLMGCDPDSWGPCLQGKGGMRAYEGDEELAAAW